MKGFRFRLDPVLRVRRHRLDQQRQALARARAALRGAEALAARTRACFAEAGETLAARMAAGLPAGELAGLQRRIEAWASESRRAAGAVTAARDAVARAVGAVLEAHREVRVLEGLREKRLAVWQQDLARREQAELDEVGARVHHARERSA